MILVDANLLVYAYMDGFPEHSAAQRWLDEQLAESADRGFGRFGGLRWENPLSS